MKKWAFVTVIMMFLNSSFATSAQGATSTIKIQKHFTATFSNSIKFAGQDCLTFQFKWNASLGLNYPYHWVTVTIENQKKKSISQNFYINPGDYYGLGQGSGTGGSSGSCVGTSANSGGNGGTYSTGYGGGGGAGGPKIGRAHV